MVFWFGRDRTCFICRFLYALEADVDAYGKRFGIGVSCSGVGLVRTARSGQLGIDGLVVFFQRRPIAEVFTRKIDAGAADTDFASEILGYGIADREIFQTQIGEILKIAVGG